TTQRAGQACAGRTPASGIQPVGSGGSIACAGVLVPRRRDRAAILRRPDRRLGDPAQGRGGGNTHCRGRVVSDGRGPLTSNASPYPGAASESQILCNQEGFALALVLAEIADRLA